MDKEQSQISKKSQKSKSKEKTQLSVQIKDEKSPKKDKSDSVKHSKDQEKQSIKSKKSKVDKSKSKEKSNEEDKLSKSNKSSPKKEKSKSKDKDEINSSIKSKSKKDKDEKFLKDSSKSRKKNFKSLSKNENSEVIQQSFHIFPQQEYILIIVNDNKLYLEKIALFCDSCEEPICLQCTNLGPHNNSLHRINRLQESYKIRYNRLFQLINVQLLEKKEKLIAQMSRIEYRIEEIKHTKRIIERYTYENYQGIIQRLQECEDKKIAILQNEINQLQAMLNWYNDICKEYMHMSTNKADPLAFLIQSKQFFDVVEKALNQKYKETIDVSSYDLPNELLTRRQDYQRIKSNKQFLTVQDDIIFSLVSEQNKKYQQRYKELNEKANQEINSWARLTDKFASQLASFQLVCYYCSTQFDISCVNQQCKVNKFTKQRGLNISYKQMKKKQEDEIQKDKKFIGYTETKPDSQSDGSGRHFFAKWNGRIMPEEEKQILFSKKKADQESPLLVNVEENQRTFFEVQLAKIRKACVTKNVNLLEIFQKHDKTQQIFYLETINHIQFAYILSEILQIDNQDMERIKEYVDPQNQNKIFYEELLRMINEINFIDKEKTQQFLF